MFASNRIRFLQSNILRKFWNLKEITEVAIQTLKSKEEEEDENNLNRSHYCICSRRTQYTLHRAMDCKKVSFCLEERKKKVKVQ